MLQIDMSLQRIHLLIYVIVLVSDHCKYVSSLIQVMLGRFELAGEELRHGLNEELLHVLDGVDVGGVLLGHQCHYLLGDLNRELPLASHLINVEQ